MTQKTAVITGGTKGIGLSITESLVEAGYAVVVGARMDVGIEDRFSDQVRFSSVDVSIEESHQKLVETALDWTGQIDVYINNAGFSEWRPIEMIDEEFFNELIGTNLKGAFWGCKAAVKAMKSGGSIVNISSIAGKRGSSNNSLYCASKFGMNGLTQALAKEVGNKGIRVNAICPVLVPTDGLLDALNSEYAPAKGNIESFFTDFSAANSALGRLPSGAEVASVCLFLASPASSAITAQCVNVDCGVLPQ